MNSKLSHGILLSFISCFILVTLFFQIRSNVPPWFNNSPIEYFTGSLLWILSFICLLASLKNTKSNKKMIFWLLGSVVLACLAIDEIFEFHERSEKHDLFNDDYIKVIGWVVAAFVIRFLIREEKPIPLSKGALFLGYFFQTVYILVELGDGEFFTLPFAIISLKWSEELSELLFLSSYFVGFTLIYTRNDSKR